MRIGITFSHPHFPRTHKRAVSAQRYFDCLADAGAQGVGLWRPRAGTEDKLASRAEKLAAKLDGLVVAGGNDLHPSAYGEEVLPDSKLKLVHPLRIEFERLLMLAMRERSKPILGICYGCQYFNVLHGGPLIQHIPAQLKSDVDHADARHSVRVLPGSSLHKILGREEIEVQSYHHQAIKRQAPSTRATAWAPDKVIEAIELDENPLWLGVQWHPECDRGGEATGRLMEAFVDAARGKSFFGAVDRS